MLCFKNYAMVVIVNAGVYFLRKLLSDPLNFMSDF